MSKPKIAFICVHNSCRSQIAEAFGKVLAADVFESYSAGSCCFIWRFTGVYDILRQTKEKKHELLHRPHGGPH